MEHGDKVEIGNETLLEKYPHLKGCKFRFIGEDKRGGVTFALLRLYPEGSYVEVEIEDVIKI